MHTGAMALRLWTGKHQEEMLMLLLHWTHADGDDGGDEWMGAPQSCVAVAGGGTGMAVVHGCGGAGVAVALMPRYER